MARPEVWGGILVGGRSRRMGTAKQNLVLDGQTFAERIAAALVPHTAGIALLGEGDVTPALAALPRVPDAVGVSGPLAGLLGAFAWRPGAAWLIVACDLPLVTADAIAWLLSQRRDDRSAIVPRLVGDRVEPLLALYEPGAQPLLLALAASSRSSLQPLARELGVATPAPPLPLGRSWRNVNTAEELLDLD